MEIICSAKHAQGPTFNPRYQEIKVPQESAFVGRCQSEAMFSWGKRQLTALWYDRNRAIGLISSSPRNIMEPKSHLWASRHKVHHPVEVSLGQDAKKPWKTNQNHSGHELLSEEATSTTHSQSSRGHPSIVTQSTLHRGPSWDFWVSE